MADQLKPAPVVERKWNALAVIGFVVVFLPFFSLVAAPLAIIALVQIHKTHEKGKGLAIATIVLEVLFIVLLIAGIVFAVSYTANNARKEAEALGTDTRTVSQIESAVNGNCHVAAITAGQDSPNSSFYVQSQRIEKVDGNFAIGKRECAYLPPEETYIAAKLSGRWTVIYTGSPVPKCVEVTTYQIPLTIAPQCLDAGNKIIANPVPAKI